MHRHKVNNTGTHALIYSLLQRFFRPRHILMGAAVCWSEIVWGCEMLEPHTATFPHGSFSRKNRAAVAFQNLDSSINKRPWFIPHKTHIHTLFPLPHLPLVLPPFSNSIHPHFFPSSLFCFLSFLLFFFSKSLSTFSPSLLPFIHPSLTDWVYSPRPLPPGCLQQIY